jgi:hypothetical protein
VVLEHGLGELSIERVAQVLLQGALLRLLDETQDRVRERLALSGR